MKRVLDVVVSSIALVVALPVLVVVAAVVRLRMGSPVVFRQVRAGRGGRPFGLYKFRTMRAALPGEEGPEFDGLRTTRLGRFLRSTSLDELPELVNVLVGHMSLVGPRPLPMSYVERYSPEQARRLEVRPGLTGWAVVHGRNHLSWDERFSLDCWYVDHRSFALDLKIIGRTVGLVLRREGINHEGDITMTEFKR
jgi:lipopolysaccharide/colanic/teichoic acid biosynthesis glycosyltransferase